MMRKAWVITLQSKDDPGDSKIVDIVNARKKIADIDAHLADLSGKLFPDVGGTGEITHPSGSQSVYETPAYVLSAQLSEIDIEIYNKFEKSY